MKPNYATIDKGSLRALDYRRPTGFAPRCCNLAALTCLCFTTVSWLQMASELHAVEQKYWELSPYRIQLQLAVETASQPRGKIENRTSSYLSDRVDSALSPLWSLELDVATGAQRHQLLAALSPGRREHPPDWEDVDGDLATFDKLMLLTIETRPAGYRLRCRELDCLTRRWGPVFERTALQPTMLPEVCLHLLCEAFAPLATVRALPEDELHAELQFKGSELADTKSEPLFQKKGDVYQPIVRRTDRSGELLPNGVLDVPWTYLTLDEVEEDGWRAAIHTGMRRPLGVRRRGRNQQLALALRHRSATSYVRFFARHDKKQGLAGYEVYQRNRDEQISRFLGVTDALGMIAVTPSSVPVKILLLRSDDKLLAKVPVVPGLMPTLEVPIADDTARLRAQARLAELREQLIDLVARRNILISRVRDRLKNGNLAEAQQLLDQLDALPGRSQFNQLISAAEKEKRSQSSDSKIQARIAKMFADTRSLLGRFLDARDISELEREVRDARSSTQASAAGGS